MRDQISPVHEPPLNEYTAALREDGVAIFLFHGVIQPTAHEVRNYTRKHLSVDRFCAVLDALCASGTPVAMPELVEATDAGRPLPPRAFLVTFDDGFANNYSMAAPILQRRRIPATFYVTTGFIAEGGCSWTDLLEHAFESRAEVDVEWDAGVERVSCRTAAEKQAALDRIRAYVKSRRDVDPYECAASLRAQLGVVEPPADEQLDRKLSWSQVRELSEEPLFTVGGHGHTHRILEFLEQTSLEREIGHSLELLRPHVVGPVLHYSYPEGLRHCYSQRVVSLLKTHGIRCAPSAEPGVNRVGDDLFHLKRIPVV